MKNECILFRSWISKIYSVQCSEKVRLFHDLFNWELLCEKLEWKVYIFMCFVVRSLNSLCKSVCRWRQFRCLFQQTVHRKLRVSLEEDSQNLLEQGWRNFSFTICAHGLKRKETPFVGTPKWDDNSGRSQKQHSCPFGCPVWSSWCGSTGQASDFDVKRICNITESMHEEVVHSWKHEI